MLYRLLIETPANSAPIAKDLAGAVNVENQLAVSASDPLQMLAAASAKNGRFEVRSVTVNDDGKLAIESPAPPSRFHFNYHGTTFTVRLTPRNGGFRLQLGGVLGHIPFTAEGREFRASALEIVRATEDLKSVKFVIAHGQQVGMITDIMIEEQTLPEAVLHEIAIILHQARPFMMLMRDILRPTTS
jgi:hypothetical protein